MPDLRCCQANSWGCKKIYVRKNALQVDDQSSSNFLRLHVLKTRDVMPSQPRNGKAHAILLEARIAKMPLSAPLPS